MTTPSPLPSRIGPYAISETVATHAFSVTYRAEQPALGRTVLIRALKPTLSPGSPFAAEIEREAAVLGRLDHESVVRAHELVRTPELVYLVLEDARAVPLDEILRAASPTGHLEPAVATAVALAAARALAHAHERGIVHRALRSSAVAVAPRGRVIVGDFSAAEASGLPSLPESIEAGEGPARTDYLAPEQILGEPAGAPADVWAIGVLCHELLTGSRPFTGDEPRDVAQRIRTGAPSPLPPSIPAPLSRTLARCLAKAPEDRFADAGAAAAALEEALASLSRLPVPVLVSRALAAAGLGQALPAPGGAAPAPRSTIGPDVALAARGLALVLALVLAGGAGIRLLDDPDAAEGEGVAESAPPGAASRDHGHLRVVARPWAEVYIDGELVETTPVGRPLPVSPGRHFVTFRHPNAPDEQRTIKISAGQSVFLDVTMRVDRGDAGAAPDGSAATDSP